MNPVLVQGLNDVHTTVGNTHPWLNVCRMKPHTQFSSFSCQPMNWLTVTHIIYALQKNDVVNRLHSIFCHSSWSICHTGHSCSAMSWPTFTSVERSPRSVWFLTDLRDVRLWSSRRFLKTDFRDQECITGVSMCWKCVNLENRTSVISSGPSVVS